MTLIMDDRGGLAGPKNSEISKKRACIGLSGGQTGERALVQEEQMGPLLTPGKISLNR